MYFFNISMVIVCISFSYFIIRKIHSLEIVKKIKNKYLSWILSSIMLLIIFIINKFDFFDYDVIIIHFLLFYFILKFIFYLINKFLKKNINSYILYFLSFLFTVIYLCNGYYLAHYVEETNHNINTDKNLGVKNFRIVQITDSHIGSTMSGKKFSKYIDDINKTNPDIVVLTGDFVDDDTKYQDMIDATRGLGNLKTKYGVYYIFGNHDKAYFNYRKFSENDLKFELEKNNVIIMEDDVIDINDNIVLIGRRDSNEKRKSIFDLTNSISKDKYVIVLDHEPNDYENESKVNVDLVLSGHTHGGQLFPIGELSLLFGINDSIYGLKKINDTNFIVSSGIGNWRISFKTFANSEYVVIDIN